MAIINKIKNLVQHQGFRRYAANTSWMLAEQMLRIVAGLLVGIWVARYLGPEQFGLFSYVLAFTAIFSGIAKLGLDGILVRELINHPQGRDIYLGTAFWLKVMGAFVVMAIMVVIVPFMSNDSTTNLYIYIIAVGLFFQSFEVVEFYFQSQVMAKIISICKFTQLALSSVVKIFLVLTQADLFWFVCVTTFDMISLAASYYVAYRIRRSISFFKKFDFDIAKQLLENSWPLIFSSFVITIYMRIDQVMIAHFMSGHDVGIYSAAVKISEVFYIIPMLLTASIYPAIINAKIQNEELYYLRISRLYAFLFWCAAVIAIFVTIFKDDIILLLYGSEYVGSAIILSVHVWSGLFVFVGVAFSRYLLVENLNGIALKRTLIGAIANVVLNYILIPSYGLIGAALATLIAQIIANYLYDFFDPRLHRHLVLKTRSVLFPWLFFK